MIWRAVGPMREKLLGGEGLGVGCGEQDDGDSIDGWGVQHLAHCCRHSAKMGGQAAVVGGGGPVAGDDWPDSRWHLIHFAGDAVEDTEAGISGSTAEKARDFSGAAKLRGGCQPREADLGNWNGHAGETDAAVQERLTGRGGGRPVFGAHRINEDEAGDFARVVGCEAADNEATERVSDEDVGGRHARHAEEKVEFRREVGRGSGGCVGTAPTKAAAVISERSGKAAD